MVVKLKLYVQPSIINFQSLLCLNSDKMLQQNEYTNIHFINYREYHLHEFSDKPFL